MSEFVPPADLREQVGVVLSRIAPNLQEADLDAVLAVFAERERMLRSRIEALPTRTTGGAFLTDFRTLGADEFKADVLGVFDA